MIAELSDRQSEVLELISSIRSKTDKTIEDGLAANLGYGDEIVMASVLAVLEMRQDPHAPIERSDLIWAGAYLDHLDTLGFEVRRKREKRGKKKNPKNKKR